MSTSIGQGKQRESVSADSASTIRYVSTLCECFQSDVARLVINHSMRFFWYCLLWADWVYLIQMHTLECSMSTNWVKCAVCLRTYIPSNLMVRFSKPWLNLSSKLNWVSNPAWWNMQHQYYCGAILPHIFYPHSFNSIVMVPLSANQTSSWHFIMVTANVNTTWSHLLDIIQSRNSCKWRWVWEITIRYSHIFL